VERLVKHLHAKGVPMAIATSSAKATFDLKMHNHKNFVQYFDPIVMGSSDEDVKHGKPAPDVFLVAARRFKDPPAPEKVRGRWLMAPIEKIVNVCF
jgi:pseudouridine-5'-monophosphatase